MPFDGTETEDDDAVYTHSAHGLKLLEVPPRLLHPRMTSHLHGAAAVTIWVRESALLQQHGLVLAPSTLELRDAVLRCCQPALDVSFEYCTAHEGKKRE